MALQVIKPYIHVEDANGNPYVGAQLYVYSPGTTTKLAVYTDEALSIAAANPASSDAAGNFPRLYLAAGTYKLRAETSVGVLIWQEDNIDTGLPAGTGALPISRGGTGATTAAGARASLDVPSNSELADLSSDIAALRSSIQSLSSFPQGYLTLTSGTPVISSDVASATAIYYTPMIGNLIPIYNGTSMVITSFSELTLALVASHVASAIYDCFIVNDAGTVRLVTGPAWNTATAGTGSRGTGSGTTELTRSVGGLLTNANAMTARYGSTTLTVEANKGTYVGSVFMDGTNGQVSCHVSYGQSRKWGVWNAYNQQEIVLRAGDSTSSWNYVNTTVRASRGQSSNSLSLFCGIVECRPQITFSQAVSAFASTGATVVQIGIGYNSTTVISGTAGYLNSPNAGNTLDVIVTSRYSPPPALGLQTITSLESTPTANGTAPTATFRGAEALMLLEARWRG